MSLVCRFCLSAAAALCAVGQGVGAAEPPVMILKLDDVSVKTKEAKPNARWVKVVDYVEQHGLVAGCGIVCNSLALDNDQYVDWLKAVNARGKVEFWFHGWDHQVHEEDGTKYNEFNHRAYDDQRQRFDKSLALAREKLGFALHTFGPGGGVGNGSFDATTAKVMADVPDMKVWLYPQPLDKVGKELVAGGKVTILDRVWAVNLEGAVGKPDLQKLKDGLAKNPGRPYYVLQGHPAMWDEARFAEFEKIIDYLKSLNVKFMTPSGYVDSLAKGQPAG